MKEYQDIELMVRDAYSYVKNTGNKVSFSRKSYDDVLDSKYIITLASGDVFYIYSYRHPLSASFKNLMEQMKEQKINFEQLINKQLLPFL